MTLSDLFDSIEAEFARTWPGHDFAATAKALADYLVLSFLDDHFGVNESQIGAFTDRLPIEVRKAARQWIVLYLAWLYRMQIIGTHGIGLYGAMHQFIKQRAETVEATRDLPAYLDEWFRMLDGCLRGRETQLEGLTIPLEAFAAWTFLGVDPATPFHGKTNLPDGLDIAVAEMLQQVKQGKWDFLKYMISNLPESSCRAEI